MNKYLIIVVVCLSPLFVFSQNVEVLGGIKTDSVNVNSGLIRNAANPIAPQDAATKAYVDAMVSPTYAIGYSAEQGGYIIWVSADGKHGLVAEIEDQTLEAHLDNSSNIISNPNNHSADGANFRDWRLPTGYELNEMYLQKDNIGGFTSGNYLHSGDSFGYIVNFGSGDKVSSLGGGPFQYNSEAIAIRSVRTF